MCYSRTGNFRTADSRRRPENLEVPPRTRREENGDPLQIYNAAAI